MDLHMCDDLSGGVCIFTIYKRNMIMNTMANMIKHYQTLFHSAQSPGQPASHVCCFIHLHTSERSTRSLGGPHGFDSPRLK